jgi:hypothetical protein
VSSWWREVSKICDGVGVEEGGWFEECVSRKVEDGVDTYFWHDRWLGGVPFCVRFRGLFQFSVNKSCSMANMFSLGWEDGDAAFRWTRRLWAWEEDMLVECRTLLHGVSLQSNVTYQWQWQLDPLGGYSVRGVYQLLTSQESIHVEFEADLIWHNQVPLKVLIFAWRLRVTGCQLKKI